MDSLAIVNSAAHFRWWPFWLFWCFCAAITVAFAIGFGWLLRRREPPSTPDGDARRGR